MNTRVSFVCGVLALIGSQASAAEPLVTRGPYLQLATDSGITVCWRTDVPTSTSLSYGTTQGSLIWTEEDPALTVDHVVALDGLSANTKYYYAVGDESAVLAGDGPDYYFVTHPLPGTEQPTRIWVLGDSGTGNANAVAVRDAYYGYPGSESTDLWLMLGDNAYPHGTDEQYGTKLFDIYPEMLRRSVLWPTIGNHDVVSSNPDLQTGPYFEIFSLPAQGEAGGVSSGTEAYYSFDHANIHFVVLDSQQSDRSLGSAMLVWLESDLAATDQDWIIVYWHHPPYSKGSHDSDVEIRLREMRENVVPILEDYGVDLVLSGHSHSYERSFLIDGHYGTSGTFSDAVVIDGGDGSTTGDGVYWKPTSGPEPHQGAVYTVSGCSSKLSPGSFDHPAMFVSFQTLGSVVLDIDGSQLDSRFLDGTGAVLDEFTIVKGCDDSDLTFSSLNPTTGNESHLFTPGRCVEGPPCQEDSVSSTLAGSFWQLGNGHPDIGKGIDSGGIPPLDSGNGGWVKIDPLGRAFIDGIWSPSTGVDGCAGIEPTGADCTAMVLADQHDAIGYFAALATEADAAGDYQFDQPAGAPISLAAIPWPFVSASRSINSYTREVDLVVHPPPAGIYADSPQCPAEIVGYKIYEQVTLREDPAPGSRLKEDGWTLLEGGTLPSGEPIPLGQQTTVTLTCYTAVSVYLGTVLVFDSGFELPMVSESPYYILCSNCEIDDDRDGSCTLSILGNPGPDCDDNASAVFPGAEQTCDGLNNDCDHPGWPALQGTNEFDDDGDGLTECAGDCNDADAAIWTVPSEIAQLRFSPNAWTLEWDAPADSGATSIVYDLLRSADRADFEFGAICAATGESAATTEDSDTPLVGEVFYYVARARNGCGSGSIGQASNEAPRAARACP